MRGVGFGGCLVSTAEGGHPPGFGEGLLCVARRHHVATRDAEQPKMRHGFSLCEIDVNGEFAMFIFVIINPEPFCRNGDRCSEIPFAVRYCCITSYACCCVWLLMFLNVLFRLACALLYMSNINNAADREQWLK
jgi:hypothetical protein